MLGKIEGRKRRGRQRKRWLDGITDAMDMKWGKLGRRCGTGGLEGYSPWGRSESGASTAGGTGLIPGQGTKIPHAAWPGQSKQRKEKVLLSRNQKDGGR